MKMAKLSDLFDIEYGHKYDLNKMIESKDGINFVSRSDKNLGIVAKVSETDKKPYPAGLITVALGGSALSSFCQPAPFYTAQNIKVLKPKSKMKSEGSPRLKPGASLTVGWRS